LEDRARSGGVTLTVVRQYQDTQSMSTKLDSVVAAPAEGLQNQDDRSREVMWIFGYKSG